MVDNYCGKSGRQTVLPEQDNICIIQGVATPKEHPSYYKGSRKIVTNGLLLVTMETYFYSTNKLQAEYTDLSLTKR